MKSRPMLNPNKQLLLIHIRIGLLLKREITNIKYNNWQNKDNGTFEIEMESNFIFQ